MILLLRDQGHISSASDRFSIEAKLRNGDASGWWGHGSNKRILCHVALGCVEWEWYGFDTLAERAKILFEGEIQVEKGHESL